MGKEPLEKLASMNELHCYQHNGFWRPMDTLRDKVNGDCGVKMLLHGKFGSKEFICPHLNNKKFI